MRFNSRVGIVFVNQITYHVYFVAAYLRNSTRVAHHISNRKAVAIYEDEVADAAFCQFEGGMRAPGADPYAENGLVVQHRGFENVFRVIHAAAPKHDESRFHNWFTVLGKPVRFCPRSRTRVLASFSEC